MIRRFVIMGAAFSAAALASCSGSDSNSSATPTPTSTATPTPTPTPTATYTSFPLTAAKEFYTINAATSYTGDPTAGAVTLGVTSTEMQSTRVKLATSNVISSGTFVIDEASEESRFTNANIQTTAAPTVTEFVFRSVSTATGAAAGNFSQLEFLNNTIPSQVTTDSILKTLTTVSYANWWRGDSTTGAKRLTYSVWGYNTVSYDMPSTGTAAYNARIVGRVIRVANGATEILRLSGTTTTSVNFATGLVSIGLNLTTVDSGGTETPYLNLTAQGAIPIAQTQFTGSFTSGNPLSGTLAGGFFGKSGANIGVVFGASGVVNGADTRIVGEIVGAKQ
ncbi:transferrin-binding protein-like solute binding protein [Sphingomonas sp. RS6]